LQVVLIALRTDLIPHFIKAIKEMFHGQPSKKFPIGLSGDTVGLAAEEKEGVHFKMSR
jgi:hypothetical protein